MRELVRRGAHSDVQPQAQGPGPTATKEKAELASRRKRDSTSRNCSRFRKAVVLLFLAAFSLAFVQLHIVFMSDPTEREAALAGREYGLCILWTVLSMIGTRRVAFLVRAVFPQYADTVFYFPKLGSSSLVALTIDDGVCRQCREDTSRSMLPEVLSLLRNHSAHATFFLCSNYVRSQDLARLIQEGHELANHMPKDTTYAGMAKDAFRKALVETEKVVSRGDVPRRWFRAPQGYLTSSMREVLAERNYTHVLGDCYADDWAIRRPSFVANLYLNMVQPGSVAIMHMPEHGFREHTLQTMQLFLEGLDDKGLVAGTVGMLAGSAAESPA